MSCYSHRPWKAASQRGDQVRLPCPAYPGAALVSCLCGTQWCSAIEGRATSPWGNPFLQSGDVKSLLQPLPLQAQAISDSSLCSQNLTVDRTHTCCSVSLFKPTGLSTDKFHPRSYLPSPSSILWPLNQTASGALCWERSSVASWISKSQQ